MLETSGLKSVLPIKLEVVIFQVKTVTILSDLRKIRYEMFLNDRNYSHLTENLKFWRPKAWMAKK